MNFILWIDDRPALPLSHVGGYVNPKFSNMISHMGTDIRMKRFRKRKFKMRKAK